MRSTLPIVIVISAAAALAIMLTANAIYRADPYVQEHAEYDRLRSSMPEETIESLEACIETDIETTRLVLMGGSDDIDDYLLARYGQFTDEMREPYVVMQDYYGERNEWKPNATTQSGAEKRCIDELLGR